MDTANRLREERERLGMSQQEMAEAGGVKKMAQWTYEKGERHPDTRYLAAIAGLGVDVLFVLTGKRSQPVESRLSKRAQTLLDNYENASEAAKHLIEGTASFAANPPPPPAEGQATKKKRA